MRQEEKGRDVNVETVEMRYILRCRVCALLCPILCDPMDCSLLGSSVQRDSQGKDAGRGCHARLQGIFPAQRLNWGLLHCRQILYQVSYQGSPLLS